MLGYDIGFMLGFIKSNLNGHLVNEYIRKQSQAYKEFTALKAIKNYLEFDELATIRLEKIYEELMKKEANLNNLDLTLKANDYQDLSFLPKDTEKSKQVILALDNQLTRFILGFYKEKNLELIESASNYFSRDEINFILQNTSL